MESAVAVGEWSGKLARAEHTLADFFVEIDLTMQGTGNFSVRSRIDGVDSNTLEMRVRAQ